MKRVVKWTGITALSLVLYVLSVGPVHGVYWAEVLPEEQSAWVYHGLYAPVHWMERNDPTKSIHDYEYWWYIKMKKWLHVPPHVDPGSEVAMKSS